MKNKFLTNGPCLHKSHLLAIVLLLIPSFADGQEITRSLQMHRVNVHGDEFMAVALSPDETRLAIGSEKGFLIIWNVAAGKEEARYATGGPVHEVAFLQDRSTVVTAGGPHVVGNDGCILRKWNLTDGTSHIWNKCGELSLMILAVDAANGLVAVANLSGDIFVYDATKDKQVATWHTKKATIGLAIMNGAVLANQFNATIEEIQRREGSDNDDEDDPDPGGGVNAYQIAAPNLPPSTFLKRTHNQSCGRLMLSPDRKALAIDCEEDSGNRIMVFDTSTKGSLGSFSASTAAWRRDGKLQLFGDGEPDDLVVIGPDGKTAVERTFDGSQWHSADSPGRMSAGVASSDGRWAWITFKVAGALAQFDFASNTATLPILTPGLPFAMAVRPIGNAGYLATGGDDKFVRVWRLNDLAMEREFPVDFGAPQSVAITADGRRVIYSYSSSTGPSEIVIADIATGERRKLPSLPEPFVYVRAANDGFLYNLGKKFVLAAAENGRTIREIEFPEGIETFRTSANARWLAVADKQGNLWLIDLKDGLRTKWTGGNIEDPKHIVVSNDGRYVFTTEWLAHIRRWDTRTQESKDLTGHRGQAACLALSTDERYVIVGGNHFDIGVYDANTGKQILDSRVDAADFYVTNAWMSGMRLIFTTDGGVLFDWKNIR